MAWTIHVPVLEHDVITAGSVGDLAAYIDDEEDRIVCRELFWQLTVASPTGQVSAAGVADGLAEATPQQRRALLDSLRASVGLKTTGEIEADERYKHNQETAQRRMDATSPWQLCGHAGCRVFPVDPRTGAPARSTIRKWYCQAHIDEQTDRDRLPNAPRLTQRPGGGYQDADETEVDEARGRAAHASQQARQQAHLAEAGIAAAEHAAFEEAQRERVERELPAVFRGHGA